MPTTSGVAATPTRLDGRVAAVTGAGSGIGAATAIMLANRGVRVCCAGRNIENVERTAETITEAGGEAFGLRVDAASPDDNEAMVRDTVARYGRLDMAHLNAAIGHWAGILDYPLDEWDRTMAVNLRGVFLGLQSAGRAMRTQGHGSIVVTSSAAGLTGVRMSAAYSASKHGVLGLVKSAALELGPLGIRVNGICPGYIASNDLMQKIGDELDIGSRFPIGRAGKSTDVANLVTFLLSEEAAYLTGSIFTIDGGWMAGGIELQDAADNDRTSDDRVVALANTKHATASDYGHHV